MPAFESCHKHKPGQSPLLDAQILVAAHFFLLFNTCASRHTEAALSRGEGRKSFGTSACWTPSQRTTAVDACCPLLSPEAGDPPLFLMGEQAAQVWVHLALCYPWGHLRNRKFPAAPQDSPNLEMVKGELNLDMIAGIWPEISSSTRGRVCCLCLNVFVCLCLKALNNVTKPLTHPTLQNR